MSTRARFEIVEQAIKTLSCHESVYVQEVAEQLKREFQDAIDGNEIMISWHVDDVAAMNTELTKEQCHDILLDIERNHDANIGIHWNIIEQYAQ